MSTKIKKKFTFTFSELLFAIGITLAHMFGVFAIVFINPTTSRWAGEMYTLPWYFPSRVIFFVCWLVIFFLLSLSFARVLYGKRQKNYGLILLFFILEWVLVSARAYVFFGLQQILWPIAINSALIVLVVVLIDRMWKSYRHASYLLMPYLLWMVYLLFLLVTLTQL